MNQDLPQPPEPSAELVPLNFIRTETALSRFPMHRIAKRGDIRIELKNQAGAILWRVGYDAEYGQPGPLAYKLDTLIINRKLEEAGRPVPKLIKLGSLSEICRDLDLADSGTNRTSVKSALFQNATASINAKITYRRSDKSERFLEALFTRYSVIFTGETLPDGRKADAVYLVLNDLYQEVLNEAVLRPLDYEYMKALPPSAQRFYEVVSYRVYAALLHRNPRAKLAYSDYCTLSTQTRYLDWDHVKKQMYKVHLPHLKSGYLAKVEYEATTDPEGKPDWHMLYTPGPNAAAEFKAFKGGGNRAVQRLAQKPGAEVLSLPLPVTAPPAPVSEPALDPETLSLVEELVGSELNHATAVLYAKGDAGECRRQLEFVSAMTDGDFTEGRGAYLARAIPEKWGPPKRYKEKQRREEAERKKREAAARENARQSHEEARRAAEAANLRETYLRMLDEQGEASAAFTAYLREQRVKQESICKGLREETRRRMLERFESEENRLKVYGRFLELHPEHAG